MGIMGIMPKGLPAQSKVHIATVIIANVKKDIFIAVDMVIMDMVSVYNRTLLNTPNLFRQF